jgi:hypothetical protein
MSRRRKGKDAGADNQSAVRVCGFRLDEACDKRLREMAELYATTPNQYARAVLTAHLKGNGAGAADTPSATPSAFSLDELGTFLFQVRDQLIGESEGQGKRLDAVTARVNALVAHINALTKRVVEVDQRLAEFLARVEPL